MIYHSCDCYIIWQRDFEDIIRVPNQWLWANQKRDYPGSPNLIMWAIKKGTKKIWSRRNFSCWPWRSKIHIWTAYWGGYMAWNWSVLQNWGWSLVNIQKKRGISEWSLSGTKICQQSVRSEGKQNDYQHLDFSPVRPWAEVLIKPYPTFWTMDN